MKSPLNPGANIEAKADSVMSMRRAANAELLAAHLAWMAKWKAEGKPFHTYTTPCCYSLLETPAPSDSQTWDSLTTCPDCGANHYKVVTRDGARAAMLGTIMGVRHE